MQSYKWVVFWGMSGHVGACRGDNISQASRSFSLSLSLSLSLYLSILSLSLYIYIEREGKRESERERERETEMCCLPQTRCTWPQAEMSSDALDHKRIRALHPIAKGCELGRQTNAPEPAMDDRENAEERVSGTRVSGLGRGTSVY